MLGQRARFERFAAEMLYFIAAGVRINTDRCERFSRQVEDLYANPFVKKKQEPRTAAEITQYVAHRIEEAIQWT